MEKNSLRSLLALSSSSPTESSLDVSPSTQHIVYDIVLFMFKFDLNLIKMGYDFLFTLLYSPTVMWKRREEHKPNKSGQCLMKRSALRNMNLQVKSLKLWWNVLVRAQYNNRTPLGWWRICFYLNFFKLFFSLYGYLMDSNMISK